MSASKKETILITGGAGFIGTHLARTLREKGYPVISLDLAGTSKHPVEGVKYLKGDARDTGYVSHLLSFYSVSTVYHLAATVSVPLCQKNTMESYSHNVTATLSVLEACRQNPSKVRVAFSSSAALYGNLGDNQEPLEESKIANRFSSFYAAQKHASEKMIELYSEYYKIPSLIFRFFNVYGHGQDPSSPYSGVITIFTQLAKEKKAMVLNNAGIQTRDFIAVTEIAQAISSALDLPHEEWDSSVINLGSGSPVSVKELAEMIRTITGGDVPIEAAPPREGDVLHSRAHIGRAEQKLNFRPTANFSQKLSELLT